MPPMESQDKLSTEREETLPVSAQTDEPKAVAEGSAKPVEEEVKADGKKKTAKVKCSKKYAKPTQKKPKQRASASDTSSGSGSDDDADQSSSSSSDSDDSASELEDAKKKRSTKKRQDLQKSKKKVRAKKQKKPTKPQQSSVSDSDSDSSEADDTVNSGDEDDQQRIPPDLAKQFFQWQQLQQQNGSSYQYGNDGYQYTNAGYQYGHQGLPASIPPPTIYDHGLRLNSMNRSRSRRGQPPPSGRGLNHGNGLDPNLHDGREHKDKKKRQKATKMDYKRVDQVWDNTIHNYKLQDTAEGTVDAQYDEFLFHVRRTFDWEGKYKATIVDIKSKLLRECLQDVIGNIKGVSLVEETPKLDPNMLFL
jgi:hypothetical protein